MDNNYHEKRKNNRRRDDGQLHFLMTLVKVAIRLTNPDAVKDMLTHAVDTIEKGEKI